MGQTWRCAQNEGAIALFIDELSPKYPASSVFAMMHYVRMLH